MTKSNENINILKLEKINKNFGELKVLKNNSLEVQKGEVVCIIGPSGAGKSTLLRSINQLESIKSGKIWVDGELLVDKEKGKNKINKSHKEIMKSMLEVGMVFQKFNLFPHITVLDNIMMPQMDGLTACAKIREFSNVPIILLTAKVEDMDKLMGFEQGADDYLTKPFNILELKARIRALLRRATPKSQNDTLELVIGTIRLDLNSRNAYRSGELVDLTAKEFDVIEFLMRNPNRVYSREALLDTIWAYEYRSDIRTVDVHIRRLREKLEENPADPQYIITKWGVGYYFRK